jgi:hypothetical protein
MDKDMQTGMYPQPCHREVAFLLVADGCMQKLKMPTIDQNGVT